MSPSRLIAGMARIIYNEPYKTKNIRASFEKTNTKLSLEYTMPAKGHPFAIGATADNKPYTPDKNSAEFFFKEHSLGVGQTRKRKTILYNVHHPEWRVFPLKSSFAKVDWTFFFGSKFSFLENKKPTSVFLAEGSAVTVYKYRIV